MYVTFEPAAAAAGPVFVIVTSAEAAIVVETVDESFAPFVSKLSVVTVTVLFIGVAVPAMITRVNCADVPERS